MLVDIVVCNYRTPGDLLDFCDSVVGQEGIGSLTIVNNAAREVDRRMAGLVAEECGARVINNAENLGYAKAMNAAAIGLTSPIMAFFNADVIASPGSIATMADFMERHTQVGVAGPKQVDAQKRIVHGGILGSIQRPLYRGWKQKDRGQFSDVLTGVVSVSGSAYFVRRECWDELVNCDIYQTSANELTGTDAEGAFLPTPLYYEETFLSVHATVHGWKNAYNGMVTMTHKWQGSCKDQRVLADYARVSRSMYRSACANHRIKLD